MKSIACPQCGSGSSRAFFSYRYTCAKCGAQLQSNLGTVSFLEWLIGGPIFFFFAVMLQKLPWLTGWPYGALAAVLLLPACVVHALVLKRFLVVQKVAIDESAPG